MEPSSFAIDGDADEDFLDRYLQSPTPSVVADDRRKEHIAPSTDTKIDAPKILILRQYRRIPCPLESKITAYQA